MPLVLARNNPPRPLCLKPGVVYFVPLDLFIEKLVAHNAVFYLEATPAALAVNEDVLVVVNLPPLLFHFAAPERREYARHLEADAVRLRLNVILVSSSLAEIEADNDGGVEVVFKQLVLHRRHQLVRQPPRCLRLDPQAEGLRPLLHRQKIFRGLRRLRPLPLSPLRARGSRA